jgi:hypothetical protein
MEVESWAKKRLREEKSSADTAAVQPQRPSDAATPRQTGADANGPRLAGDLGDVDFGQDMGIDDLFGLRSFAKAKT